MSAIFIDHGQEHLTDKPLDRRQKGLRNREQTGTIRLAHFLTQARFFYYVAQNIHCKHRGREITPFSSSFFRLETGIRFPRKQPFKSVSKTSIYCGIRVALRSVYLRKGATRPLLTAECASTSTILVSKVILRFGRFSARYQSVKYNDHYSNLYANQMFVKC